MNECILDIRQLSKTVNDVTGRLEILHPIDIRIDRGDTVAIVGASGSGKSTLLSLLAGLDTPSQGSVYLNGIDLFQQDEDERARIRGRSIGFVFQNFQLLPHFTALENVMLPLELADRPGAEELARDMLQRVGLGARLRHYPRVLSGGEQQRVALARAFVMQPDLLLADEPTGSLDHASGAQVMDLMFELNRERGTTLVLVTHDLAVAARCQRRLNLSAGHLHEEPMAAVAGA